MKAPTHYLFIAYHSYNVVEIRAKVRDMISNVDHTITMKDEGDDIRIKWTFQEQKHNTDVYATSTALSGIYVNLVTTSLLKECVKRLKSKMSDLDFGYKITHVISRGNVNCLLE